MRIPLVMAAVLWAAAAHAGVLVIDGDTVDIDGIRVRIEAIDTPETWRARCAAEYALGQRATARLGELLAGRQVTYIGTKIDRYGRVLATVYADGEDVGQTLLNEGLAVRWRPGAKAKARRLATWCPTG